MTNLSPLSSLARDRRGIAATEFGLILPVFALLLMGGLDISHTIYMRGVVHGALQQAARKSTLEVNATTVNQSNNAVDNAVKDAIRNLNTKLTYNDIQVGRRYYKTFTNAAAAQAETYTDTDGNGTCNNGEPFSDANNNGTWDKDGGNQGQGGAHDITVITVNVSYPHLFPLWKMLGTSNTENISAETVLANQPYGAQAQYGAAVTRNCP